MKNANMTASHLALIATLAFLPAAVFAADVPFTESFPTDSANWADSASAPLLWTAIGGADGGGYGSGDFQFATTQTDDDLVVIRGQANLASSGNAFVGNWIDDGVTQFSAFVRHDAGVPLTFFTRFASPFNYPGGTAVNFFPVPSGEWTPLIIPIAADNPQFISFEGMNFDAVFSNVGNIQIGVRVPESLAGVEQTVGFDLDMVSIVPEPATLCLLGIGGLALLRNQRRVRRS